MQLHNATVRIDLLRNSFDNVWIPPFKRNLERKQSPMLYATYSELGGSGNRTIFDHGEKTCLSTKQYLKMTSQYQVSAAQAVTVVTDLHDTAKPFVKFHRPKLSCIANFRFVGDLSFFMKFLYNNHFFTSCTEHK